MSVPQNVRASDRKDLTNPSGKDDFVIRRRFPSVRQMAQLCLLSVIVVLGVSIIVSNDTMLGALICILVGSIMLYLGRSIERQQKVINATEFMNALFSSALCRNHRFCAVVREDGEIIYLDRGFQEMFPDFMEQPSRDLATFIKISEIPDNHGSNLTSLITSGGVGQAAFSVPIGSNKISDSITVTVEPIARPKGFSLVRGA